MVAHPARRIIVPAKATSTDRLGNFTIPGNAPGEYKLIAWDAVPPNAWMNNEFMRRYEAMGEPITLRKGETVYNKRLRIISTR
jgi:hypothetical protein